MPTTVVVQGAKSDGQPKELLVGTDGTVQVALAAGSATIGKVDQGVGGASAWKVDGSAVTQPVSAVSLPLPTGAASAAKQPALGTAGTPSADVLSVQGVAGGTAVPVSLASVPSHAVTVADGADVAEGATADAAVVTDTTGTLSGKLRGLVKWAFERMPASLGQKTMAASLPVVVASDQAAVPTTPAQATAANLNAQVVGALATGAAASGNPVIAGAEGRTTQITSLTDGQVTRLLTNAKGGLHTVIWDGAGANRVVPVTTMADALAAGPNALMIGAVGLEMNNAGTLDRARNGYATRSDTYTGAADGTELNLTKQPLKFFSVAVKGTGGAATAWSVVLEGSLDNVSWTTITTHGTADGDGKTLFVSAASPVLYLRSRCVSLTLGGATNIVTTILGVV